MNLIAVRFKPNSIAFMSPPGAIRRNAILMENEEIERRKQGRERTGTTEIERYRKRERKRWKKEKSQRIGKKKYHRIRKK